MLSEETETHFNNLHNVMYVYYSVTNSIVITIKKKKYYIYSLKKKNRFWTFNIHVHLVFSSTN